MKTGTIFIDSEDRRQYALRLLSQIKIDPPLDVTITEHVERRSVEQNSRLWSLHGLAAEHVGCSAMDMHDEMLAEHFGYTEVQMPSGDIKRVPLKRSSARDKKEFSAFMNFVEMFYASKLGVWLP